MVNAHASFTGNWVNDPSSFSITLRFLSSYSYLMLCHTESSTLWHSPESSSTMSLSFCASYTRPIVPFTHRLSGSFFINTTCAPTFRTSSIDVGSEFIGKSPLTMPVYTISDACSSSRRREFILSTISRVVASVITIRPSSRFASSRRITLALSLEMSSRNGRPTLTRSSSPTKSLSVCLYTLSISTGTIFISPECSAI